MPTGYGFGPWWGSKFAETHDSLCVSSKDSLILLLPMTRCSLKFGLFIWSFRPWGNLMTSDFFFEIWYFYSLGPWEREPKKGRLPSRGLGYQWPLQGEGSSSAAHASSCIILSSNYHVRNFNLSKAIPQTPVFWTWINLVQSRRDRTGFLQHKIISFDRPVAISFDQQLQWVELRTVLDSKQIFVLK